MGVWQGIKVTVLFESDNQLAESAMKDCLSVPIRSSSTLRAGPHFTSDFRYRIGKDFGESTILRFSLNSLNTTGLTINVFLVGE